MRCESRKKIDIITWDAATVKPIKNRSSTRGWCPSSPTNDSRKSLLVIASVHAASRRGNSHRSGMTGRQLIPIQPKPSPLGEDDPGPLPNIPRRGRNAVLVACDPCRRLKTKCDGERPACRKCRNKGQQCTYEFPEDAQSRSVARKEITNQLQRENRQLRQLFHDLSRRPETEALHLFQRLRAADDPIALAYSIRQAELLLPNPTMEDRGELTMEQQLELDAFGRSPIKISARPWTTVAGDGIVSELISAWFKWDNAFLYPFIDRECFIQDIREGDPKSAMYCSPFLVNAICALRSYFSDTIDMVQRATKVDMKELFLNETKKLYDHVLPTIPTIQGLWILFTISTLKGEDRNGSLYRFASYGMLKRCKLNQVFWSLADTNPEDIAKKRVISKTVWGLFCLESITATNFRNTDILRPPKIPCLFSEFNYEIPYNVDLFGQEFTASSAPPSSISGVISTFCRLAVLMSEVLTLGQGRDDEEETGHGEPNKLRRRKAALAQLNTIGDSLPSALRHSQNFTPETCFFGVAMNTVAYTILRPLHPDMVLDENNGKKVKSTVLDHCELDMDLMERYFATWSTVEFSTMAFLGPLNAGTVLLPLLPDERAQQLFPRICRLMRTIAARMPIAKYVLKGWQAALWSRKLEIPGPAEPYFRNLGDEREVLGDIPTSLVVAHVPTVEDVLTNEWDDGELGFLLKKWRAMSLS
ncbi:putative C6 transcription factor [Xylaria cf. heliscus]|nr:putative C6 transcription factor [Xylaria cf. heliscus]